MWFVFECFIFYICVGEKEFLYCFGGIFLVVFFDVEWFYVFVVVGFGMGCCKGL